MVRSLAIDPQLITNFSGCHVNRVFENKLWESGRMMRISYKGIYHTTERIEPVFYHNNKWSICSVSSDSLWPFGIIAYQAPLPMEFSRHKYWSRLPFPPTGGLPDPGIEPTSLVSPVLAGGFFTSTTWEALNGVQPLKLVNHCVVHLQHVILYNSYTAIQKEVQV